MLAAAPLLTAEQVSEWVRERAEVAQQHEALGARLEDLDRKLEAVRLLLPAAAAALLLEPNKPREHPNSGITDYIVQVLQSEPRGYSPAEVRAILKDHPEVGERVRRSINIVSNALIRLLAREEIAKHGAKYYWPETYERIQHGEIEEVGDPRATDSFNALMHKAMRAYGRPFSAKMAMQVGKQDPEIAARLTEQPSRIYSWLSRELGRNNLNRVGMLYSYPANGNEGSSASPTNPSDAEEAATSSIENRPGFRLVG
jgi:hypothetical protein